ncbi:MAG TPA: hypothetical protein VF806_01250 [Anaerolineaceae bacterium]
MIDPKFAWELVGLFLTLIVMLYMIFGDNALFRIITYTFIGIASGYVTVVVIFQVLLPRIFSLVKTGNLGFLGLGLIPFVLGLLLFLKFVPRLSSIATLPMAVLVGVGAAIAVGGAMFGTLFGQVLGTISLFRTHGVPGEEIPMRLLEGVFILVGAACTLAYFQFGVRRKPTVSEDSEVALAARRSISLELLSKFGQVFIGITLGAMFAGVYTAAVTALIERIGFVIDIVTKILGKFS